MKSDIWKRYREPEKAQQLGLPVTGHRAIRTSDRQTAEKTAAVVELVRAERLEVAGRTFASAEGVVSPDSRRDGTLGITLFRDVLLTLDYPHDRLSISEGTLPAANGQDVELYTRWCCIDRLNWRDRSGAVAPVPKQLGV